MILNRYPHLLRVKEPQGLPDYINVALKNVAAIRFGKANNPQRQLRVPPPQLLVGLLALRLGFQVVLKCADELGHQDATERILTATELPAKAQNMSQDLKMMEDVPAYMRSYRDCVRFGSMVLDSMHIATAVGIQFGLWKFDLFDCQDAYADLFEDHDDLAWSGEQGLFLDLDENQQLVTEIFHEPLAQEG